jgi:hypothetical protein
MILLLIAISPVPAYVGMGIVVVAVIDAIAVHVLHR